VRATSALASILAMLALAAPAAAQEAVVGEGTVITDPASETETPEPADDLPEPESDDVPAPEPDASGKRGELHVLGTETASSPSRTGAAPASTLPFTGVEAWVLALAGLALLGSGLAVRRATRPAFHTRPGPR
jgi:hypothetical protein